ncbi:MAG: patatin-like phospholipase family protein [Saprospiraceae bacterium]|nr:patatin-like phospholipase family protein [Saprospiraceae bacterium]
MQDSKNLHLPRISVVLGSGGLRPIASIALFDFLLQENIAIDLLLGCSGGSIFASMYNMGYQPDEMKKITKEFLVAEGFSNFDYRALLSIAKMPGGRFDLSRGLLKNDQALETCQAVFKDKRLEDLPIEMKLQTTDIQTGEGFLLEKGSLAEAVYASAAMYPLLAPIYMEDRWLVDGAFSEPLPITEAIVGKTDIIIAMIFNEQIMPNPRNFLDGFYNINRIYTEALTKSQLAMAVNLHHYEIIIISPAFTKPFSYADPSNIDELIEIGREAVLEQKDEILAAIQSYSNNTPTN